MSFQQKRTGFKSFHKSRDKNIQKRKRHEFKGALSSDSLPFHSHKKREEEMSGISRDKLSDTSKPSSMKKTVGDRLGMNENVSNSDSDNYYEKESMSIYSSEGDEDGRDSFRKIAAHQNTSRTVSSVSAIESFKSDSEDSELDNDSSNDNEADDMEDEATKQARKSDEYDALKKELANVPLEDLMKIKEKIGLKAFNKVMHGGKKKSSTAKRTFKRENKNRPREMTSKRPVRIARHMDNLSQKHLFHRDPRFDDLSGEYKDKYFEKNYAFLNDLKNKEKKMVKKEMKRAKETSKKKDLQGLLMRMTQQEQVRENKRKKEAIEATWKNKEKEMVKQGKLPYFLKKSEKKKLELAEKYKELQKSGKLEQYLSKKRKKNAQRERKKLPQQMNNKR